jgi:predicted PurR-regulated permease PerM
MSIGYHANITFGALKRWFISQCYDSLAVAAMWVIALLILRVPFAPFWALLAGALQFIPNFGLVLALIGPAMAILFTGAQWERFIGLLIAYALIAVIDGIVLQPYLMKRQNRVPWWASTFVPIFMGFIIPFWGVLIAPPMLAVYYAYRKPRVPEPVRAGEGIVLPPKR